MWIGEKKERFGINTEESKVVGRIFHLYVYEKRTLRSIARLLSDEGVPSPGGKAVWYDSTVRRILEDPTYIGKGSAFKYDTTSKNNGKYSSKLKPEAERLQLPEGVVPAIVDEEIFAEAQIRLRLNQIEASRNNPNPEKTLLRCGYIKCGYCKRTMYAGRNGGRRKNPQDPHEYRCIWRYKGNRPCKEAPVISINRIDRVVWEYIGKKVADWTVIEKAINLLRGEDKNQPDLKSIDHSINITKASQEQLVLDLKQLDKEGFPKLKGRARQLVLNNLEESENQLSRLMKERLKVLAGQSDWQKMQEDIDKFLAWCLTARDSYQDATYEEKRRALRVLGIVVYVYREDDETKKGMKSGLEFLIL